MYIPMMHIITANNGNNHEQDNILPLVPRRIVEDPGLMWHGTALHEEGLVIYRSNRLRTFLEEEDKRGEKGDFASSLNTEMPNFPHLRNIRIFWFDKGARKEYLGFSEIPDQSYTKYLKVVQFIHPRTMASNYLVGPDLYKMIRMALSGWRLDRLLPEYMYEDVQHNSGEGFRTNFSTNGMKMTIDYSGEIEILQKNVMIIMAFGTTIDDVFRYDQNGELLMRENVIELIKNLEPGQWYRLISGNRGVVFDRIPRERLDLMI